jgi:homospermidine synthase
MIGFGSIGSGTLPLIIKHLDMPADRITVLTGPDREEAVKVAAKRYGVNYKIGMLLKDTYLETLAPLELGEGDFCLNLSVDVGSCDMLTFCNGKGVMYLDTVVEPWLGGYFDGTPSERSNYAQREEMLALKVKFGPDAPTAVVTHGANPGLVSHFVKQALLNIAKDTGVEVTKPASKAEWAALSHKLGVKTIHIAERDTQVCGTNPKKPGEFVNTWSVDGFISEGCQPAELGWGSHEKALPHDGAHHTFGTNAAIYLNRPGAGTKVRTWTPTEKEFHGFLVTHNESISIADYFTVHSDDPKHPTYRPTVHYAYHPADDAVLSLHELCGKNYVEQTEKRLMVDEITEGIDELGVLLCGHAKGAYWYGSQLEINNSRKLVETNSATSLQVTATALAGMIWAMENPKCGIMEPDEIDFERVLEIAVPYCVPVVGEYTDWTPLYKRETLFPEDLDKEDPWQFKNFRVL